MSQHRHDAAYIRVSSKAQTLEMQRSALVRAAAARGDTIRTWYAEKQSAKTRRVTCVSEAPSGSVWQFAWGAT